MEQNNGGSSDTDGLVTIIKVVAFVVAAYLAFLAIVYGVVFVMVAGAIYLGAKLGAGGSTPLYEKVRQIEATKRSHRQHLEGESPELLELAESRFEDEKMQLYRPKDEVKRPGISFERTAEFINKLRSLL